MGCSSLSSLLIAFTRVRPRPKPVTLTREEIIARNLVAVDVHFHNENPEGIDLAVGVYTDDIVWEAPASSIATLAAVHI